MKTVFLTLCFIGCIILSPLFLLSLSLRYTPITPTSIKGEIAKLHLYDAAVNGLNKQMEATTADSASDDPFKIIAPFVKKEITASYVQSKIETLIDDAGTWMREGTTTPPVMSFSDLKEKMITQNKRMITELESAVSQMDETQQETQNESGDAFQPPVFHASDIQKFLKSDFTLPVGQYLSGLKFMLKISKYLFYISGGLSLFNLLLIVLIAPGLQSKLRWIGCTFLFTALWNVPGALVGAGSSVMIASMLTKNVHGVAAQIIKPLIESIITPILLTYTRITGGVVIALFILSIGMIVLAFITKPVEIAPSTTVPQKSKKK